MITLKSHGFKFSRPEANFVFDVSYFANPWRDKGIRECEDAEERKIKVIAFMQDQSGVYSIAKQIAEFIRTMDLLFPNENMQIAICCSAGEYRSPAMVELIEMVLNEMVNIPNFIIKQSENSKI